MSSEVKVLLVGSDPWKRQARALCPDDVPTTEAEELPPSIDGSYTLVIVQPDHVPDDDFITSSRRHGSVRWLCCGEVAPSNLSPDIDWRSFADAGLRELIATRLAQMKITKPLSNVDSAAFRRMTEENVFFPLIIDHAHRLLKGWELAINPGTREQGEGRCDDLGLKHHLNRLHHLLSNSIPLVERTPPPTLDPEHGSRIFNCLHVSQKTVFMVRHNFPKNICDRFESTPQRTGLPQETLVRSDENFLISLLITILSDAPIDRIATVEIELLEGKTVGIGFPFEVAFPAFGSGPNASGPAEIFENLARILSRYSASQSRSPGRYDLFFQLLSVQP